MTTVVSSDIIHPRESYFLCYDRYFSDKCFVVVESWDIYVDVEGKAKTVKCDVHRRTYRIVQVRLFFLISQGAGKSYWDAYGFAESNQDSAVSRDIRCKIINTPAAYTHIISPLCQ
jgi:hypothetical protein